MIGEGTLALMSVLACTAGFVSLDSWHGHYASWSGAQGLGQLMPETANELAVGDPFDPAQNLEGAARYLGDQLRSFQNVRLALAAYHAGPERAGRGLASVPTSTRSYIARVLRYAREYRHRGLP